MHHLMSAIPSSKNAPSNALWYTVLPFELPRLPYVPVLEVLRSMRASFSIEGSDGSPTHSSSAPLRPGYPSFYSGALESGRPALSDHRTIGSSRARLCH